ncbi:Gldg family protein [Parasphingorhabdus sp.]|uniref:Gldg family protein n=1 Tax=Parasphingorhabdus sp. TaxID=2709688 RepID=UPI003A9179D1
MPRLWRLASCAMAVLLVLTQCSAPETPPEQTLSKPRVQLMTSLPLVWGDNASMESILSGGAEPAAIYRYWQDQYDITALDSLERLEQDDPDILLLAQPRAMDPADLAILDDWVRSGGAVIILTDPDLVWPSALPLGDRRRPLVSGLLSPLLSHWGLELVADAQPDIDAVDLHFGDHSFVTQGIGKLKPITENRASGVRCKSSAADFIVQCSVGQGRASIIADADFLNAAYWPEPTLQSPQNSGAVRFIDSLVDEHIDSNVSEK